MPGQDLRDLSPLERRRALREERDPTPENPLAHFVNELPEPVRRAAGGAIRNLASALEPLQLPQDAMFAVLAGAIDPNTTILGRLQQMRLSDYAPGGEAPPRISSGEEIFNLMGLEGPAAKWAGIAADLTVDPLVFGAWLRLGGKMSGVGRLMELGDKVDDFISPIGMGREVTRAARRSPTLSRMMDDRMAAIERAFRDPNSTLFGIRRFGTKATDALERFVLPKQMVDRLRYGGRRSDEGLTFSQELGGVRRAAEATGLAAAEDPLKMLKNAIDGVDESEQAKDILRTVFRGEEERRLAWEARLSALDPTVREVVEQAIYETTRPGKNPTKDPGFGLLAFLDTPEGVRRVADPDVRRVANEAFEALRHTSPVAPGARTAGQFRWADYVDEGVANRARDKMLAQQERVAEAARLRAQTTGLVGEDATQSVARAVRAYNNYLGDTLIIDAKLGLSTSGLSFVRNQVLSRVVELTGNSALSEDLLRRLMAVGLRQGNEGIEALKKLPISEIPLSGIVSRDVRRRSAKMERAAAYERALAAERTRIMGANEQERVRNITLFAEEIEDMSSRASRLSDEMDNLSRQFHDLRPARGRRRARDRSDENSREATKLLAQIRKATDRYRNAAADVVAAGGSGLKEMSRVIQAERRLLDLMPKFSRLMDDVPTGSFPVDPRFTTPPAGLRVIDDVKREMTDLVAEMSSRHGRRTAVREAVRPPDLSDPVTRVELRDARRAREQGIRERANAAADAAVPRSELLARPTGTLVVGDEIIPFQGRNAIGEDILAHRVNSGKFESIDDALNAPLTWGELIDGSADLQALPIGDLLQGLMTGHLRRAYALFGDVDDFQKYVDNLRVGTIIPSSIIDEAALFKTMPGFEREAQLIVDYHTLLQRGKRGVVLKKASIYEHLVASGVEPARANESLKRLVQSLGPENGNLREFLNLMDEFVPNYRAVMQDRNRRLANMGDSPRAVSGTRYFDPVEQVPQNLLEGLGEIAMARASLTESAEIARRTVGRQEAVQGLYRISRDRGLLRSNRYTDEYGVVYEKFADNSATLGGFAGKYMHPYLVQELRKMTAVKANHIPEAVTRVRALITGGYLAAPSVIAANFFGGLYQAATVGINPAVMMRRITEVMPELNRASLGFRSDLVHEIKRNLNMDISSLTYQDMLKDMNKVRLDDFGLGKEGLGRAFDDVARMYENFLQRPGIGKYRTRFAGLDGFQFTENLMKVAGYVEMKSRLTNRLRRGFGAGPIDSVATARIEKQAAEFARTIVFDYSELPTALDSLKRYGLVLFPGFTYFLAGRTIDAALRRPGALAVADRISEAVSNATLSTEEQIMAHLGTPDWMKDDQGVPMPFTMRRGPSDERTVSMIPLNQLVPTSTIWDFGLGAGNPWSESIASGGLWGPFAEVIMALVSGEGEAPITGRYGNRVFDADSEGTQKASDVMRFLFNTLAPSNVKKLITENMEGQMAGILPEAVRTISEMGHFGTEGMTDAAYTFDEQRTLRPDKGLRESIISGVLRSPQVVALEGPIVGMQRELRAAQTRLGEQLTMIRRRANRARSEGDDEGFERWSAEITRRQDEFNEHWLPFLEFHSNFVRREEERRRLEREQAQ